jgi:hypothetical protein
MTTDEPVTDADVIAQARAKLHELALCDLRYAMPRLAKVYAGGPIEGGMSTHEMTRAHLRQLLTDIENSKPE